MTTLKRLARTLMIAASAAGFFSQSTQAATFNPIWRYGGKSVVVTGKILPGDAQRLFAAVKSVYDRNGNAVERVFLNSPGGDVKAGFDLAMYVRELGIDAVVGKSDVCASICFFVFAAARHRALFTTSKVGVHSVYGVSNDGRQAGSDAPRAAAITRVMAKLYKALGVPDAIIVKMMTTDGDDMAWLHGADASGWQVEIIDE
jgi:hypothetical protein